MFTRSITRFTLLATLGTTLACGGVEGEFDPELDGMLEEQAGETAQTDDELTFYSVCLTNAPDATLLIRQQPEGYYFGSASSGDTSYASSGCASFLTDMTISAGYDHSSDKVRLTGFTTNTVTQTNCDNIENRVSIYRKSRNTFNGSESDWELIKSETKIGQWRPAIPDVPAHCDYAVAHTIEKPSLFGVQHIYRVMVRPKIYGYDAPAKASWHWTLY